MSIPQNRPAYRILSTHGFFGPDDHLYNENECIVYDGEPNEEMEPLNTLAEDRLQKYVEKLDTLAKITAEKLGRPYVGRPKDLDGIFELARKNEIDKVAIMGAKKEVTSIEGLGPNPVPETGNEKTKKGRPARASLKITE